MAIKEFPSRNGKAAVFVDNELLSVKVAEETPFEIKTGAGVFIVQPTEWKYSPLEVEQRKWIVKDLRGYSIETRYSDDPKNLSGIKITHVQSEPSIDGEPVYTRISKTVIDEEGHIVQTEVKFKGNTPISFFVGVSQFPVSEKYEKQYNYIYSPRPHEKEILEPENIFKRDFVEKDALRGFIDDGFPLKISVEEATAIGKAMLDLDNPSPILPSNWPHVVFGCVNLI